jgi:uncharacterized protein
VVLPDVNVLTYAVRPDFPQHTLAREWLEATVNSPEPFGMSPQALASSIRILTNARLFREPVPLERAIQFCDGLIAAPNCRLILPGMRHWDIFTGLCRRSKAKGNLVQDAWWAALTIESGCEWITCDRDFARFPDFRVCGGGLRSERLLSDIAKRGPVYTSLSHSTTPDAAKRCCTLRRNPFGDSHRRG